MNKEELAPKLAEVMDTVPVCEGLIYAKISGEIIIGQTIIEHDHALIAKKVCEMLKYSFDSLEKGAILELTITMETGILIAATDHIEVVIGILGEDGKSSVGLLLRQLKNIMT